MTFLAGTPQNIIHQGSLMYDDEFHIFNKHT